MSFSLDSKVLILWICGFTLGNTMFLGYFPKRCSDSLIRPPSNYRCYRIQTISNNRPLIYPTYPNTNPYGYGFFRKEPLVYNRRPFNGFPSNNVNPIPQPLQPPTPFLRPTPKYRRLPECERPEPERTQVPSPTDGQQREPLDSYK